MAELRDEGHCQSGCRCPRLTVAHAEIRPRITLAANRAVLKYAASTPAEEAMLLFLVGMALLSHLWRADMVTLRGRIRLRPRSVELLTTRGNVAGRYRFDGQGALIEATPGAARAESGGLGGGDHSVCDG